MGQGDCKSRRSSCSFNPSPEHERSAAKRYHEDYDMTLFLQSTQAWKWRVEEEGGRGGAATICRQVQDEEGCCESTI